jgi:hypothetical protein
MDLEGFLRFFLQPVAFHRFGIRDLLGDLLDLGVFSKQTCGKIMSQGTGSTSYPRGMKQHSHGAMGIHSVGVFAGNSWAKELRNRLWKGHI